MEYHVWCLKQRKNKKGNKKWVNKKWVTVFENIFKSFDLDSWLKVNQLLE